MRAGLIRRPRPTVVGRYRVVGELGRGGMGVVYEAVDRRLHRRLAIKLVAIERQRADQRFRMRREAEAMARLSHPNVVQVFDVGRFEDQTFVAMELVEGTTLAGWCRARRRTVDTIVAAFRSAGAGLAAAHDAGVVHRDFKPKNVLVGIDGTVKVTDFGLAQLGVSDGRHGAGTPAYMAPEQRRGVADARSDQYSFCVALHEAVFGVLPGRQQGTLPAARGTVPPELRTTIERGLAANGDDRFPSMPALLRTLHQRRRGPSWLWWGGAAALGVASLSTLRSGEHPCEASVSIDDIWNEAHSDRTRRAFTATALPFAPHAAERVSGMLDSYATQWRLTQRAVCELRAPSAEALATQRACLEQRARELAALADLLEAPSTSVVLHAVGAAHRLRQPAECIQPGVAVLEGAPHLLEELASLRADDLAGGGRSAIPRAEALLEQASAAGDGAIFAEARFIQGRFLERAGEYAAAREALEDAFHRAVALGDDGLAARAATMLVTVDGIRRLNPDKAAGWARHGLAALDRTDSPLVRASLLVARGGAATTSGRFEDATADYEAALSLLTSELSEDEFSIAATLNNLATVHARLGDYDAAESELTRALASFERDLGTAHPSVAATIANLAALQTDRGNHEAALETLLEASQRLTAALGRDHPTVAKNETNIGLAYLRLGRLSEAERHLGDALEIRKRVLRADHPEIGYAHTNRGHARAEDERWAAAASDYRKAIDILSAEFGVHDARVADPTRGLADVELAQGDWRAASALAEGALRSIDFTGHPATETALRDVVERALTRSRDAL